MDALKTINSNNFISFSLFEHENKSNSKDLETENYSPFHDNLSQSTLINFQKIIPLFSSKKKKIKKMILVIRLKRQEVKIMMEKMIIFLKRIMEKCILIMT